MREMQPRQDVYATSGFFAIRTPLLSFDEFQTWSDHTELPLVPPDCSLIPTIASDRTRRHTRLMEIMSRPETADALFIASADVSGIVETWPLTLESKSWDKVERTLVNYFTRMTTRVTPFGLFAGCSYGRVGTKTRLRLSGRDCWRRRTQLDVAYLVALVECLEQDFSIRRSLFWRPNSSLYRAAGRLHYAVSRLQADNKLRSQHLVALLETDYLLATLERARDGVRMETLTNGLVDEETSLQEADTFIEQLIDAQILVSDLIPEVTGPEPLPRLISKLCQYAATRHVAEQLDGVRNNLALMDEQGCGVDINRYREIIRSLQELPAPVESARLFRVDLLKPADGATLSESVLAEIVRGVEILHRLTDTRLDDRLLRFRKAFTERYGEREVPFVEALDGEIGVGFGTASQTGAQATLLVEGLEFLVDERSINFGEGAKQGLLLHKIIQALDCGSLEIVLSEADVKAMENPNRLPLPDAFAVTASIAASSEAAISSGDFLVQFGYVVGPSGARMLGRFCYADEQIRSGVMEHLRVEESLHPEAVFAEIVYQPGGTVGNAVLRPVLRDYEITLLGRSGAEPDCQLPVTDLLVAVTEERIVLRSRRLGCEVIPRLTNAHNANVGSIVWYRFLTALQSQGVTVVPPWDWGTLSSAPFLPRIRTGRTVLARARWNLEETELNALRTAKGPARFQFIQSLRAFRKLPRHVVMSTGDNELVIDLNNMESIETFVRQIKRQRSVTLVEMFPGPDMLVATGPEGKFVHELIIPFTRQREVTPSIVPKLTAERATVHRRFSPGSEWLYAKLYTGPATADRVLRTVVAPVVMNVRQSGAVDSWFFIRYGDPDWHLRLRFHGSAGRLNAEVLPALQDAVGPLLDDGSAWRLQVDTYDREVERYGGKEGVILSECLFSIDSDTVLAILATLAGDENVVLPWQLALLGIDQLLSDLGLGLMEKQQLMRRYRGARARELVGEPDVNAQLAWKFRQERQTIERVLDVQEGSGDPLGPYRTIFGRRSEALVPMVADLVSLDKSGQLRSDISSMAMHFVHMYVNRLLQSRHRQQELVLYDMLDRFYFSRLARQEMAQSRPARVIKQHSLPRTLRET